MAFTYRSFRFNPRGACSVFKARSSTVACCVHSLAAPISAVQRRHHSSSQTPRVAVLYQELDPPLIDGTRKPKKPGGYRDSGADIAYNLSKCKDVEALCPSPSPDPAQDEGWCFPDNEDGILQAIDMGATHIWANTIIFASHPLQSSARIGKYRDSIRVIGQGPLVVDKYDDKAYVNGLLRKTGDITMPRAWPIYPPGASRDISYPVVAKPTRGRGSWGVKVCRDLLELSNHTRALADEGISIMIEEFLGGEEATVTVMPPLAGKGYWSLPIVTRFNHQNGIAPYSGVVAITQNSKAVLNSSDRTYEQVARECEQVARVLAVIAPIRVDVRRFNNSPGTRFALFDVNMKPNMTGPGRPGRDDQASLTLMAAAALGWDYKKLLAQVLKTSAPLRTLRSMVPRKSA